MSNEADRWESILSFDIIYKTGRVGGHGVTDWQLEDFDEGSGASRKAADVLIRMHMFTYS